ncbi:MAG TPA: hypothetical protein VL727_03380 [Puia sp.]|nr:hypothetical protein [Puia sp.]
MKREIPFEFIFDYLLRIETTVKPYFGMFAIYSGERLLLMLRQRDNEPEMNGIWIATAKGGHESLKKELPALRTFSGLKEKDSGTGWQMIPATADDLEETAIKVCELIVRRDPRIGKIPPLKRKKRK